MKRALLSVTDRTGIVELAYGLKELGYEVVASGGTALALRQAELDIEEVKDRRALLDPGILDGVQLVAVTLYPLAAATADREMTQDEALDYVDVYGSALLRTAARQFRSVIPLCDPADYQSILDSLRQYDRVHPEKRQSLAAKAFHYCAYYDTTVAQFLGGKWDRLPDELAMGLKKSADLRYGENPQQQAALYSLSGARPWGLNAADLLYGKPLSYNHYLDLETAWGLATELAEPACAIVKHSTPSGVAVSERLAEAARLAYRCDPRGCFRGTAAVNREVEEDAAAFFAEEYVQLIAAPEFSAKALDVLKVKKDIRLVRLPSTLIAADELDFRAVAGGVLVQDRDNRPIEGKSRVVTRRAPTDIEQKSLRLAWITAKHAKTHAAVIVRGIHTIGIGSGQTSRLDAVRLALVKSQERHPILPAGLPMVLASDGALSAEHVLEAARAGIGAVVQPGGTLDDRDAIDAADSKQVAMVFTGTRHFRH